MECYSCHFELHIEVERDEAWGYNWAQAIDDKQVEVPYFDRVGQPDIARHHHGQKEIET